MRRRLFSSFLHLLAFLSTATTPGRVRSYEFIPTTEATTPRKKLFEDAKPPRKWNTRRPSFRKQTYPRQRFTCTAESQTKRPSLRERRANTAGPASIQEGRTKKTSFIVATHVTKCWGHHWSLANHEGNTVPHGFPLEPGTTMVGSARKKRKDKVGISWRKDVVIWHLDRHMSFFQPCCRASKTEVLTNAWKHRTSHINFSGSL